MKCDLCETEAEPNRKLCLRHLTLRRQYTADYRDKMRSQKRCVACGGTPLVTAVYCASCRILNHKPRQSVPCTICKVPEHTRKDHKVLRICWYCPKKVVGLSNLCAEHHAERHERERLAQQDLRDGWRKEGRWIMCGDTAGNLSRCEKHRRYAAKWEKERRTRPV